MISTTGQLARLAWDLATRFRLGQLAGDSLACRTVVRELAALPPLHAIAAVTELAAYLSTTHCRELRYHIAEQIRCDEAVELSEREQAIAYDAERTACEHMGIPGQRTGISPLSFAGYQGGPGR